MTSNTVQSLQEHSSHSDWSPGMRILIGGLFVIWAVLAFLAAGSLMVGHWYTLPQPSSEDPRVSLSLSGLRDDGDQSWFAVHVLYSKCRCSQRIIDHLASRAPQEDVDEIVLLVGESTQIRSQLDEAEVRYRVIRPATLGKKFGISAAPLLAVLSPSNEIRYLGGYTDRKQGLKIKDREIIQDLIDKQTPASLPLFGCAVSKSLQALLDPLGVKYGPDPSQETNQQ